MICEQLPRALVEFNFRIRAQRVKLHHYIRNDFMYVGVAWVHPWLIALEEEYIRLTLIIMVVGMLLKGMILCTLHKIDHYSIRIYGT